MSGVNFEIVKQQVPLAAALALLGWQPTCREPLSLRGPCPVHRSRTEGSRTFSVSGECWYCWKCRRGGGVLDLWAAVRDLDIHPAAIDLCRRAGVQVPWLPRREDRPRRPRQPRNRSPRQQGEAP